MEQSTEIINNRLKENNIEQHAVRYKELIEAILFVEVEPVSYKKLSDMLKISVKEIRKYINELAEEYETREAGIHIVEIGNGIKMTTNPKYAEFLKEFYKSRKKVKFSKAALETLAIIAYKQPITKAEIEDIRGVSSDFVVRDLLEKRLVRITGRKDVPGKPMQYGTTKEFLLIFGLKNINDLPTLKEIKELNFE